MDRQDTPQQALYREVTQYEGGHGYPEQTGEGQSKVDLQKIGLTATALDIKKVLEVGCEVNQIASVSDLFSS